MSIRRSAVSGDRVAVLQRAALQDVRLSYRARGVLCAVLSRPPDWRTSAEQLAKEGTEGRDAIRSALAELVECGYLRRVRHNAEGGRFVTEWDISDDPVEPDPDDVAASAQVTPVTEKPPSGNQPSADPPSEDQASREGLETGGRDNQPSPPSPTSPAAQLLEALVGGLTDANPELAGRLTPTVLAPDMHRLVHLGWTPLALRRWAEHAGWANAGPGAVVVRVRDLGQPPEAPRSAVPAPQTLCPRHPAEPAGRCPVCEQEALSIPAEELVDHIAAVREAAREAVRRREEAAGVFVHDTAEGAFVGALTDLAEDVQ